MLVVVVVVVAAAAAAVVVVVVIIIVAVIIAALVVVVTAILRMYVIGHSRSDSKMLIQSEVKCVVSRAIVGCREPPGFVLRNLI